MGYVTAMIGCHNGHMIRKLQIASMHRELSDNRRLPSHWELQCLEGEACETQMEEDLARPGKIKEVFVLFIRLVHPFSNRNWNLFLTVIQETLVVL